MYGIVVCPKCGRPQGVRLSSKTATCQCGKRLVLRNMNVLFSTKEARELPEALGRVRAQLSGNLADFEAAIESRREQGPSRQRVPGDRRNEGPLERAMKVLRDLNAERKGFDLHQAEEALLARGLDAADILAALLREGLIYEFERGFYRPV